MREFYLVDEVGATFYFGSLTATHFVNVTGIGVERANTYLKYENVYKLAKKENPMGKISGTVIFTRAYAGYTSFLAFLKQNKGDLRLFYKADKTRYVYVEVASLSKTELNYGVLQCELTLDKLSMWLYKKDYIINVNGTTSNKVYPYPYPYTYSISFNGEVTVVNDGCMKSPLKIEMTGKVNNPVVKIIKDGVVLSVLRLIVATPLSSDKIIVDANVTKQVMEKISGTTVTNIYNLQDFTCENFLFLDIGTYTIRFEPGTSEYTMCKISFTEMYEGN